MSLRPLWDAWLYSTDGPGRCDRRGPTPDRPGRLAAASPGSASATVVTALCGYAVLYLAARDLEPAGFSVFGVFWGAFGLVTGAANGLLQEATREVRVGALHRGRRRVRAPIRCGWPRLVGVVAAAVIAAQLAAVVGARVRRIPAAQSSCC